MLSFNGVTPSSIEYNGVDLSQVIYNGVEVWNKPVVEEGMKYIKFSLDPSNPTSTNYLSARNSTLSGSATGIHVNRTIQWSTDGETWKSWTGTALTINATQDIYLRSNMTVDGGDKFTNFYFPYNGVKVQCSGDMRYMAMTNNYTAISDTIPYTNCYINMFASCNALTTAPNLPATTLASDCYQGMFFACTALTTAPNLPATTLASNCYINMFSGCNALTTAPNLPATTLASNCYQGMFYGCTALTTAPNLPATTLASDCYISMFLGCTALTTAPNLPATTLASNCYINMFSGCKALTTAPNLPATTLASNCYQGMFYGCTALTTAPNLPATTLASNCYNSMFYKCASLVKAPDLPATVLEPYCYYAMFEVCTSLSIVSMAITNATSISMKALYSTLRNTGVASKPPNKVYCDYTPILTQTSASARWVQDSYANRHQPQGLASQAFGEFPSPEKAYQDVLKQIVEQAEHLIVQVKAKGVSQEQETQSIQEITAQQLGFESQLKQLLESQDPDSEKVIAIRELMVQYNVPLLDELTPEETT